MEIGTHNSQNAGDCVCWQVNWIRLPATVVGSFQSELIQFILKINILAFHNPRVRSGQIIYFWLDQDFKRSDLYSVICRVISQLSVESIMIWYIS